MIRPLPAHARPRLPRVWIPRSVAVVRGAVLPPAQGGGAAAVVGANLGDVVDSATAVRGEVVLKLRSGIVVELGRPTDLALKVAIARRLVPRLTAQERYLDVSVPERPVAGTDTQVSG